MCRDGRGVYDPHYRRGDVPVPRMREDAQSMTEYEYKRETFEPDSPIQIPDEAIIVDGGRSWSTENEEWRHVWVEYLTPTNK